jgi:hypothetical protein
MLAAKFFSFAAQGFRGTQDFLIFVNWYSTCTRVWTLAFMSYWPICPLACVAKGRPIALG